MHTHKIRAYDSSFLLMHEKNRRLNLKVDIRERTSELKLKLKIRHLSALRLVMMWRKSIIQMDPINSFGNRTRNCFLYWNTWENLRGLRSAINGIGTFQKFMFHDTQNTQSTHERALASCSAVIYHSYLTDGRQNETFFFFFQVAYH